MPSLSLFKLAAFLAGAIVCAAALVAWRADRRDRAQLAAELAATKQLLTAADARQRDRDAQLAQTLSALATQKRAIATPAQIIRELPKNIPLPAPLTLQADHLSADRRATGTTLKSPAASASTTASSTPKNSSVGARLASPPTTTLPSSQNPADGAFLPREDLKPLYDFTLSCQACQAKLSVVQNDLADEKAKTLALARERDDAVRLAKGGSAWRRAARAAKWFLLGAAAGAIVAKTSH